MNDQFDLKGATPESWLCVDCGINTAPGYPTRVEMERAFNGSALHAKPTSCPITFNEHCEVYMVRDSVWQAARLEPMGGCICIGCLEKRLRRKLRPKDFPRRHPFNGMPCTSRLFARRNVGSPRVIYVNPRASAYIKEVFAAHFPDVRRVASVKELLLELTGDHAVDEDPMLAAFAAVSIDEDGKPRVFSRPLKKLGR
jgi:hypothetical protein